jgi:hypothetical protein
VARHDQGLAVIHEADKAVRSSRRCALSGRGFACGRIVSTLCPVWMRLRVRSDRLDDPTRTNGP